MSFPKAWLMAVALAAAMTAQPGQSQDARYIDSRSSSALGNIGNSPMTSAFSRFLYNSQYRQMLLKSTATVTIFAPISAVVNQRYPEQVRNRAFRGLTKSPTGNRISGVHIVPGAISGRDLRARIRAGKGRAILTTIDGSEIVASLDGDAISLTGPDGATATITSADHPNLRGSIVHVIDDLLID